MPGGVKSAFDTAAARSCAAAFTDDESIATAVDASGSARRTGPEGPSARAPYDAATRDARAARRSARISRAVW